MNLKLAIGPEKASDLSFGAWESILAEIIVGDAFGVDRMDYLLRDSHHAGVPYGRFDHHRLIDTLRILPSPPAQAEKADPAGTLPAVPPNPPANAAQPLLAARQQLSDPPPQAHVAHPAPKHAIAQDSRPREPALGIEEGGLHSAAALMVARFFMYSQLYFHPVRRAYDVHLKDFLGQWLPGGRFSTDVARHIQMTDNEVTVAVLHASRNVASDGHDAAQVGLRIVVISICYINATRTTCVSIPRRAMPFLTRLASNLARIVSGTIAIARGGGAPDFPVLTKDGRIASSLAMSETLTRLEAASFDFVFVDPKILIEAKQWLEENRPAIITPAEGQNDE